MKHLLEEFFTLTGIPRRTVWVLALVGIVSGGANAVLMAIVGETLRNGTAWQPAQMAGIFVFVALVYFVLQRYSISRTACLTEEASGYIRTRLLDADLKAPLAASERFEHHYKRLVLSRDAAQVASGFPGIVGLLSAITTVCCALVYLFWLSLVAGIVVCTVIGLAIVAYQTLIWRTTGPLRNAYVEYDRAFGFIDDLLLGHKELKLDAIWSREFVGCDLNPAIGRAAQLLGKVHAKQQNISLIGIMTFVGLLGTAVFVPPLLGASSALMVNTVVVLLFIHAYVFAIVQSFPQLVEMGYAMGRIRQLMDDLSGGEEADAASDETLPADWHRLHLCDVGYRYASSDDPGKFALKHVNLTIERGQLIFIVGGNGSGKTTLAKILLGLYRPSCGEIRLDDVAIDHLNRHQYRQMFNAVFTNVHLFRRRVEGALADPDSSVRRILDDMSIELAVSDDQRLDVRPFSQGQKKRLASALALMNDKPMCLFDEWTADQDPEFRAYFHNHYLPALKAAGKTLLVISHDDHYFHNADIIVRMEDGQIVSALPPENALRARKEPDDEQNRLDAVCENFDMLPALDELLVPDVSA
ncbi:MAG: ATP-binding cassette domain-containing protein [Azoarcus sp.]|jgi:putative ATP-binding cassette transporter|nr:ATP-binding cassette domain-containing protein [Azoarcus sp.]